MILVTGGAGFIGSHIVHALISRCMEVVVVDDMSTGQYAAVHPDAKFYQWDYGDIDKIPLGKIDTIFHTAASSSVPESMMIPMEYYENNVMKTKRLIDFAVDRDIPIVFSSSAAVYGQPTEDRMSVTKTATNPINPYGETKLICERMLRYSGVRHVSLRYFNVAGAMNDINIGPLNPDDAHLITRVVRSYLDKRPFTIYGDDYDTKDKTCERDYVHIMDVVMANARAAKLLVQGKIRSATVNIGTGVGTSVREICDHYKDLETVTTGRRPGDPSRLVADITETEEVLGLKPMGTLKQMIEDQEKWERHVRSKGAKD